MKNITPGAVSPKKQNSSRIANWLRGEYRRAGFFLQVLTLITLIQCLISYAQAQTDIASSLTTLNAYWTTAVGIGVLVLLWVVGRMLVHRGTRG